jgi:hypothetical protein
MPTDGSSRSVAETLLEADRGWLDASPDPPGCESNALLIADITAGRNNMGIFDDGCPTAKRRPEP